MPTPVRYLVLALVAIGVGAVTWGVGGLLGWDAALLRYGDLVFMDAGGAIGIGALAGAASAPLLFRAPAPSRAFGKGPAGPDDFR
jgi:hypothetical protein